MKKILYVDANVNRDRSRTERLAQALLARVASHAAGEGEPVEVTTLVLEEAEGLIPLTGAMVDERQAAGQAGDFDHPVFGFARQFAEADEVIFAAPYWDFSFPSLLKIYFELLCAQGLTFRYSPEGIPTGMCKAKRAWYVTTVGGYAGQWDYGLDQVRALCTLYFGIPEVRCVRAEGLDIITNDAEALVEAALAEIDALEL